MRSVLAVALVLVSSCSDDARRDVPAKTEGPITFVPSDAGVSSMGSGMGASGHSDNGDPQRPVQLQPLPGRERHPIDVTLRSSPPGAAVAVDGTAVGVTPAFWSGFADGRQHEFVFQLPRHAIARYRFVPVSSGVIHARLDPIAEERDAGIAPPPEVVPNPAPSAIAPPPPPMVPPEDAAVAPTGSASPPTGSATTPPSGSAKISGPGPQP